MTEGIREGRRAIQGLLLPRQATGSQAHLQWLVGGREIVSLFREALSIGTLFTVAAPSEPRDVHVSLREEAHFRGKIRSPAAGRLFSETCTRYVARFPVPRPTRYPVYREEHRGRDCFWVEERGYAAR